MSRLRNRVVFLCLVKLRNFHWPPLALQVKMLTVAQEALHLRLACTPLRLAPAALAWTSPHMPGSSPRAGAPAVPLRKRWARPLGAAGTLSCSDLCCDCPEKPPDRPGPGRPRSSSCSLSIQFPSWFRACLSRQPDCGYHAGRTPAFPGPGAEWLL